VCLLDSLIGESTVHKLLGNLSVEDLCMFMYCVCGDIAECFQNMFIFSSLNAKVF